MPMRNFIALNWESPPYRIETPQNPAGNRVNPIQAGGEGTLSPLQVFALLCQNGLQWADETF